MDLVARLPVGAYVSFQFFRGSQPLAVMAVDVARLLQLRQLAEKSPVAEQLDVATKGQTVAVATE